MKLEWREINIGGERPEIGFASEYDEEEFFLEKSIAESGYILHPNRSTVPSAMEYDLFRTAEDAMAACQHLVDAMELRIKKEEVD